MTYLLLELLVDGIQSVLYRDSLHVTRCDFQPGGPYEVDLLDHGFGERLLEQVLVFDGSRG